jgi:hypothetical protein
LNCVSAVNLGRPDLLILCFATHNGLLSNVIAIKIEYNL